MSVLFIGGVFADENQAEVIANTKGYAEFSANIFQQKLIRGFLQNNADITVLSAPLIASYPNRYKQMFFKGFSKQPDGFRYVPFNNLWGYRNFSRAAALKKEIRRMLFEEQKQFDLIVVYCAHEPFLEAAAYAKTCLPDAKICFVVPDLSQYMNLDANKTKIYDILKKVDIWRMDRLTAHVDSFVVLTEHMKAKLGVGTRPCLVAEGIIDTLPEATAAGGGDAATKTIVYAGKLNQAFGICDLVDAFVNIPGDNYRLVLCGDGDAKGYILSKREADSRIDYKGQVSPKEAREIIQNADVLVNPRPNDSEYTKYSFPSKNIEYLCSGKPVVCYLLDGMPRAYADFVYPVASKEQFKDALISALENDNTEKFATFCRYAQTHLMANAIAASMMHFSREQEKEST